MRTAAFALFAALLMPPACKGQPPRPRTAEPVAPDARAPAHCQVLRGRLCDQFGQASGVCAMANAQTAVFSPERCAAMLDKYEESASAAFRYAEAQRALTARDHLTPHGPAPSVGAPDASVTLVVFSDFGNPEAGRGAPVATVVKNLYPDKVRLVFRQFPSQRRADAHLAAEAGLAAHAQGKFWAYHDVLFGNPQAHDRAALERYAKEAGLDMTRFLKALDQRTFAADVDADVELGRSLNVRGVPTMFANGKVVPYPYTQEDLSRIVRQALGAPN